VQMCSLIFPKWRVSLDKRNELNFIPQLDSVKGLLGLEKGKVLDPKNHSSCVDIVPFYCYCMTSTWTSHMCALFWFFFRFKINIGEPDPSPQRAGYGQKSFNYNFIPAGGTEAVDFSIFEFLITFLIDETESYLHLCFCITFLLA
jgi:hypothetical protein